jgi:hypothetical protein
MTIPSPAARDFELSIGQVLEIGRRWVAVLSVDSRDELTLITSAGERVPIRANRVETEVFPRIWITRILGGSKPRLRVSAPGRLSTKLRPDVAANVEPVTIGDAIYSRRRVLHTREELRRIVQRTLMKVRPRAK